MNCEREEINLPPSWVERHIPTSQFPWHLPLVIGAQDRYAPPCAQPVDLALECQVPLLAQDPDGSIRVPEHPDRGVAIGKCLAHQGRLPPRRVVLRRRRDP